MLLSQKIVDFVIIALREKGIYTTIENRRKVQENIAQWLKDTKEDTYFYPKILQAINYFVLKVIGIELSRDIQNTLYDRIKEFASGDIPEEWYELEPEPEYVRLVMPNKRPKSWNTFYTGTNHHKRTSIKNKEKLSLRAIIDPEEAFIFKGRIDIKTTVYFPYSPQDPDNICDKVYIDALKGWYIAEDDRKNVREVITEAKIDKQNPRIEIELFRVVE